MTSLSPPSDLFLDSTYGPSGATFFRALHVPHLQISRAHIATGSHLLASQWGFPVTVWPIGHFKYVSRVTGLIYDDTDMESPQRADLARGPLQQRNLRTALIAGDEVLFQCRAFYILPEYLLPYVLAQL